MTQGGDGGKRYYSDTPSLNPWGLTDIA
jgi:hypothetical protein